MKARNPKVILDIYKHIPSYGENSISLVFTDSDLIIDVLFDSGISNDQGRITLSFSETCFFSISSFPGVRLDNIEYEIYENLGALIEYENSTVADKWSEQLPFYSKIRHYVIYFLSENKRLEVFSGNFKM